MIYGEYITYTSEKNLLLFLKITYALIPFKTAVQKTTIYTKTTICKFKSDFCVWYIPSLFLILATHPPGEFELRMPEMLSDKDLMSLVESAFDEAYEILFLEDGQWKDEKKNEKGDVVVSRKSKRGR